MKISSAAREAVEFLKRYVPSQELLVIVGNMSGEEGEFFQSLMVKLAERIRAMPVTYDQDGKGCDAVAHLHYFTAGCDWWITERDFEDPQHQAFGQADFGYGPELGYISIVELLKQPSMQLDLYFEPKTLGELRSGR